MKTNPARPLQPTPPQPTIHSNTHHRVRRVVRRVQGAEQWAARPEEQGLQDEIDLPGLLVRPEPHSGARGQGHARAPGVEHRGQGDARGDAGGEVEGDGEAGDHLYGGLGVEGVWCWWWG